MLENFSKKEILNLSGHSFFGLNFNKYSFDEFTTAIRKLERSSEFKAVVVQKRNFAYEDLHNLGGVIKKNSRVEYLDLSESGYASYETRKLFNGWCFTNASLTGLSLAKCDHTLVKPMLIAIAEANDTALSSLDLSGVAITTELLTDPDQHSDEAVRDIFCNLLRNYNTSLKKIVMHNLAFQISYGEDLIQLFDAFTDSVAPLEEIEIGPCFSYEADWLKESIGKLVVKSTLKRLVLSNAHIKTESIVEDIISAAEQSTSITELLVGNNAFKEEHYLRLQKTLVKNLLRILKIKNDISNNNEYGAFEAKITNALTEAEKENYVDAIACLYRAKSLPNELNEKVQEIFGILFYLASSKSQGSEGYAQFLSFAAMHLYQSNNINAKQALVRINQLLTNLSQSANSINWDKACKNANLKNIQTLLPALKIHMLEIRQAVLEIIQSFKPSNSDVKPGKKISGFFAKQSHLQYFYQTLNENPTVDITVLWQDVKQSAETEIDGELIYRIDAVLEKMTKKFCQTIMPEIQNNAQNTNKPLVPSLTYSAQDDL